ncbi:MAG TPA: hypothetical protein VLH77_01465 [Gammaproteobacteria bacterium]|nr:hypothetical protein [Gammaproteobacteria bacterium]
MGINEELKHLRSTIEGMGDRGGQAAVITKLEQKLQQLAIEEEKVEPVEPEHSRLGRRW